MNFLTQISQTVETNPEIFIALTVWSLFWKGLALWRAARLSSRNWFIVILVLNTLGILEIIYLYVITREKRPETEIV